MDGAALMGEVALPVFVHEPAPTHPILGNGAGPYSYQLLSDPAGLTKLGAFIDTLPPGSAFGHCHWYECEDEMVYVLSNEVVLVEDCEATLFSGDVAAWPAGHALGHRLDNRSAAPWSYLVIGIRNQTDISHFSDHNLITHKDGIAGRYFALNGHERQV